MAATKKITVAKKSNTQNVAKKSIAKKPSLYTSVKTILEQAQNASYKTVNSIMVVAYWHVGKLIVEQEQKGNQKARYGDTVLQGLSTKLNKEFKGGFSVQSLWNMRQFYNTFPILSTLWRESKEAETIDTSAFQGNQKNILINTASWSETTEAQILSTVWRELSWSQYKLLMRVENTDARTYYMKEAVGQNWGVRGLDRQISSFYYERILSSKNKKAVQKEAAQKTKETAPDITDFIKDPYVLEFLQIKPSAHLYESELEQALLNNIQHFLLELGKGFAFVSRQQHIDADTEHYYIDLVFYNYILKCFVLLDLKVGKLTHQDVGQMDMYVRMYEEKYKQAGDNPTIGLILCSEQNESVIKYSVLKDNRRLFSAQYKLYLPSEKELKAELNKERALIEAELKQKMGRKKAQ
jgi:predicted nuclease of restriction endonuclease-like (RecB) superfamily